MTAEQATTIAGSNRYLVDGLPLKTYDCSQITDGYAALMLATDEGLQRLGIARDATVEVAGYGQATDPLRFAGRDILRPSGAYRAMRSAYEMAGVTSADVDVAEVHDASAMGEIIQAENLGLVALGEGGPAAERGEFTVGGRIPINPSGGLESKGHPLGATGIGQLYELVTQLRGEAGARQVDGARHAIQENGGGLQGVEEAAVAIHILRR